MSEMEHQHMNLENINSPERDYETPIENNPQPEERNTHTTVNLPRGKANEKVCETINIFKNYDVNRVHRLAHDAI